MNFLIILSHSALKAVAALVAIHKFGCEIQLKLYVLHTSSDGYHGRQRRKNQTPRRGGIRSELENITLK